MFLFMCVLLVAVAPQSCADHVRFPVRVLEAAMVKACGPIAKKLVNMTPIDSIDG